jgi:hypothetical protein
MPTDYTAQFTARATMDREIREGPRETYQTPTKVYQTKPFVQNSKHRFRRF